jgi:hypothetical protein
MTTYTAAFSDDAVLVQRSWFITPGAWNVTVPAGAKVCRASALACGGCGDNWGGGGARARSTFPVTPGENLKLQTGNMTSASVLGDSWVKRNDDTLLVYADRGRGDGTPGRASNSFGDVKFDGSAGSGGAGGASASDAADTVGLGLGGLGGSLYTSNGSEFGGGGHQIFTLDTTGVFLGYVPVLGGTGLVVLEFFDIDPGY